MQDQEISKQYPINLEISSSSEEESAEKNSSEELNSSLSRRARADYYWEKYKPKIGITSNLFGTFGDTASWCSLFSTMSGKSTISKSVIAASILGVAAATACETFSEYATNQNHNSLNDPKSHDQQTDTPNDETMLLAQSRSICNWQNIRIWGITGGVWIGYSTAVTSAALLALDSEIINNSSTALLANAVGESWPNWAIALANLGLIGVGMLSTVADIRLKYRNIHYYLTGSAISNNSNDIDTADFWTKINPISNFPMIYGHSAFYRNIVIIIATVLFSTELSNWFSIPLGIVLGGLPAIAITYGDYIQNTIAQDNSPTVGNQDVELNTKGKILAAGCRVHYANEANIPGVQGLQWWFGISPKETLIVCLIFLFCHFVSTAADTDSMKGELKKVFPDNLDVDDETNNIQPNCFAC